jgi:NAD(P)H dehydrogenase (quinone)
MSFFRDTQKKKITLLLGHPDTSGTICGELALLYESAAKKAGHEVRRFNLGEMNFDPILHKGYKTVQPLEPDLIKFQTAVRWCDHFVIIYPNWWCTMPALLKGLFDRAWLPGFCFHMIKNEQGKQKMGWQKLLKGRTARVVVVSGNHPLLIHLFFGDYTNEIARGILWFAGLTTKVLRLGPADHAPEWKLNEWRRKMARLGKLGE